MKLLVYGCLLIYLASCTQKQESLKYDTLIKGGLIIDGSGSKAYQADLLVNADTIAWIGSIDTTSFIATKTIDATGKVITPGFIDAHAHGDPLYGEHMNNFLSMGVTTIALGQDGFHPSFNKIDMQPMTFLAWLDSLEKEYAFVNVAMFVGHASLREEVSISSTDVPEEEQLNEMERLLDSYLSAGCFGMSTGLEYVEAMNAQEDELHLLAKKIGEYDGLIMSHMRNEDDDKLDQSIAELIEQGNYARVHISHLKSVYGKGVERAKEILSQIEKANDSGILITADVYPYMASYTTIGILFPEWAKTQESFDAVKKTRLKELRTYLYNRVQKRNGPQATLLATEPYRGKTLAQAAEEEGSSYVDILMNLGPRGGSGAYFIMDDELTSTLISAPETMISSDGSPTMHHPRGYGAFTRIIERYVMERETLTLENAVRKMTSIPSQTIGLEKRGLIQAGNYADLLVFDPAKIHEQASYEDPHKLSSGMEYVFINGTPVIGEAATSTGLRVGRLIRKN